MWRRIFLSHPASVGESYLKHARTAFGFSRDLLAGGLFCLIHAIFPCLFKKSASKIIARLHDKMVVHR